MDTDKELLQWAAKAVEIDGWWSANDFCYGYKGNKNIPVPWNPLTNDGDALRLAVNLSILCYVGQTHDKGKMAVATLMYHTPHFEALEDANTDQYAAVRRAIVRAAAEIGKTK